MVGRFSLYLKAVRFGYRRYGIKGAIGFSVGGLVLYVFAKKKLRTMIETPAAEE